MKKKYLFGSTLLLAGLMSLASCTSDDVTSAAGAPSEVRSTVPVAFSGTASGSRTQLVPEDNNSVVFTKMDVISVFNDADNFNDLFSVDGMTGDTSSEATFTGTSASAATKFGILYPGQEGASRVTVSEASGKTKFTVRAEVPSVQTAVVSSFDPKANVAVATAEVDGKAVPTFRLRNVCGLMKFKVGGEEGASECKYTKIRFTTFGGEKISGPTEVTVEGDGEPSMSAGDADSVVVEGSLYGEAEYYAAFLPNGTADDGTPAVKADSLKADFYDGDKLVGSDTIRLKGGRAQIIRRSKILAVGTIFPKNAQPSKDPLKGEFAVASGRTVKFAPGNLYAIRTLNKGSYEYMWEFEKNQYDCRSCNFTTAANVTIKGDSYINGVSGTTPDNTSGLFQWIKHTMTTATDDPMGSYGAFSNLSNSQCSGQTSDHLYHDWGKVFGDDSKWYTLSSAEWGYLMNTRPASTVGSTANARYARIRVNISGTMIPGILLFPDVCTWPSALTAPKYINNSSSITDWSSASTYTEEDFRNIEDAGCVFLPCAGNRNGSSVFSVGSYGYYWSSSPYTSNASSAYSMHFGTGDVNPQSNYYRSYGFTVRLVYPSE